MRETYGRIDRRTTKRGVEGRAETLRRRQRRVEKYGAGR